MIRAMELTPMRKRKFWPMVLLLIGSCACTQSFSPIVLETVEKQLTFEVVIQNPKAYVGSVVLWGGVIRTVMLNPEGTQLIVTQTSLDSKGYPQTQATEGEFIAHTPRHLDLEIFHRDMKVTIAGEITGVEERQEGPMEYPRPVIEVIEIRPWEEKMWGIFPISRGWKIDQYGPLPSPLGPPHAP